MPELASNIVALKFDARCFLADLERLANPYTQYRAVTTENALLTFNAIESDLTSTLDDAWDDAVDSSMRDLETMINNSDLDKTAIDEEIIALLILRHLDLTLGSAFFDSDKVRNAIKTGITRAWRLGMELNYKKSGHLSNLDYIARDWLQMDLRFWLRHRWETDIREKIAKTALDIGIEKGLGRRELGREMARAFKNICDESAYYWEVVGSTGVTRARSWSSLVSMAKAGIKKYTWYTVGDERVCPVCGELHGVEFIVEDSLKIMQDTIGIDDPLAARNMMPWMYYSSSRADEDKDPFYWIVRGENGEIIRKEYFSLDNLKDGKWLTKHNFIVPPIHGGCRCIVLEG